MALNDKDIVIISAKRTAIGTFGGALKDTSAVDLGVAVVKNILEETGLTPEKVDSVAMGNVIQSGLGQNTARQISIHSGLPYETTSYTLNMVCGSGLRSIMLSAQGIQTGNEEIAIAGGTENMSLAPYLLPKARFGYRLGDGTIEDSLIKDGLSCAINKYHMGITAENVAEKYNITREEQDQFALTSQQRATKAQTNGDFKAEIVPITLHNKKGDTIFDTDEHVKPNTTLEGLNKLKPAFKKDGTVTAGNASGINDGAAAVLLMTYGKAKELGLKPIAKIISFAAGGVDPSIMGIAPIVTINKVLKKADLTVKDLELIELNEAFAAQSLACVKELKLDTNIVNIYGGAIALGHPIGCSGARILVTLLNGMKNTKAKIGLASLCIGGGQGVAVIVENLQ